MTEDPLVEQDDASTPLSPEEQEGLIPSISRAMAS